MLKYTRIEIKKRDTMKSNNKNSTIDSLCTFLNFAQFVKFYRFGIVIYVNHDNKYAVCIYKKKQIG